MLTFNAKHLFLTIILFAAEIIIALYIKDTIVRPFVGDVLVVVLVYCFVRTILNFDYLKVALAVFIFACLIEVLQYFDYVKLLGLENNRVLSVALGRTFEWSDFAAYFTGFILIVVIEKFYVRYKTS